MAALVVMVAAPPSAVALLPALATQAALEGAALGVLVDAEHDLDRRDLAVQVGMLQAGSVASAP